LPRRRAGDVALQKICLRQAVFHENKLVWQVDFDRLSLLGRFLPKLGGAHASPFFCAGGGVWGGTPTFLPAMT
jgi:hypothetical protein